MPKKYECGKCQATVTDSQNFCSDCGTGLEHVLDASVESVMNKLKDAPIGSYASGGGHSGWKKMGDNSWKNEKTGATSHDAGVYERVRWF
jgi:hypothetical protein